MYNFVKLYKTKVSAGRSEPCGILLGPLLLGEPDVHREEPESLGSPVVGFRV